MKAWLYRNWKLFVFILSILAIAMGLSIGYPAVETELVKDELGPGYHTEFTKYNIPCVILGTFLFMNGIVGFVVLWANRKQESKVEVIA